jgi:hypothetical protein
MTLDEAKAAMPDGYRLEHEQVTLVPPLTADGFSVYVEREDGPHRVFCGDTPARALGWAEHDAGRATMEA